MSSSSDSSRRCEKFSGAGVLIIEAPRHGGELHLVVFHDKSKHAYSDPGGQCEHVKHKNDPLLTAVEELYEESGSLLRIPEELLSGYVEKTVGRKNNKWYRGYLLFTEELDDKDFYHNIKQLERAGAPKYLQETDGIERIPLSDVYRAVMMLKNIDSAALPKVISVKLKDKGSINLHRRLVELLRVVFEDDPEWILQVMAQSAFGVYQKQQSQKTGLIEYVYSARRFIA